VAKVIHSFGREDQLDRDALSRLVASISRYLGPSAQLQLPAAAGDGGDDTDGELAFVSSRQLGGTWVLDGCGVGWASMSASAGCCAVGAATRPRSSG